jgi:hypothetical protein
MMRPVNCTEDELAISVSSMVDVLLWLGNLGPQVTREAARAYVIAQGSTTLDSRQDVLIAMLDMSVDCQLQYVEAREDRIFLCNTVHGGSAYLLDCGPYRVFLRDDKRQLTPPVYDV